MKIYTLDTAARSHRQRLRTELARMPSNAVDSDRLPQAARIAQIQLECRVSAARLLELHPNILKPCGVCGEAVHHGVELPDHLQEQQRTVLCASCITAAAQLLHLKIK
jgi:hypothetical protein